VDKFYKSVKKRSFAESLTKLRDSLMALYRMLDGASVGVAGLASIFENPIELNLKGKEHHEYSMFFLMESLRHSKDNSEGLELLLT